MYQIIFFYGEQNKDNDVINTCISSIKKLLEISVENPEKLNYKTNPNSVDYQKKNLIIIFSSKSLFTITYQGKFFDYFNNIDNSHTILVNVYQDSYDEKLQKQFENFKKIEHFNAANIAIEKIKREVNSSLADFINEFIESNSEGLRRDDLDDLIDEIQSKIETITSLTKKRVNFSHSFKAKIALGILQECFNELSNLTDKTKKYSQNLGVPFGFITRASAIFGAAEEVTAVSYDKYSNFWLDTSQRELAQTYTKEQAEKTNRLFVFSNIVNARKYRNVLNAHFQSYGKEGSVFFCTENKYINFLRKYNGTDSNDELNSRDFAILTYKDQSKRKVVYEAQLTKDNKLLFQEISQEVLNKQYHELMKALSNLKTEKLIDDNIGFYKWKPEFSDKEVWEREIDSIFIKDQEASEANKKPLIGDVYHMFFINKLLKDKEENLVETINSVIRPELESLKTESGDKLVDEFWFGSRSEEFEKSLQNITEEKYGGPIKTQNEFTTNYPYCLVVRIKNLYYLQSYYKKEEHEEKVRKILYSMFDDKIRDLYNKDLFKSNGGPTENSILTKYAIENIASHYFLRADYLDRLSPNIEAVPFTLNR